MTVMSYNVCSKCGNEAITITAMNVLWPEECHGAVMMLKTEVMSYQSFMILTRESRTLSD